MKTFSITTVLLAALAIVAATSVAGADDVGVVRLGRQAPASASTDAAIGGVVVRGQSGSCPLGAQEPQGFLQKISRKFKRSSRKTDSCDGCDRVLRCDAYAGAGAACDGCAVSAGAACDACDACTNIPAGTACKGCVKAPGCRCETCACCDCEPECKCESCDCCSCTVSTESRESDDIASIFSPSENAGEESAAPSEPRAIGEIAVGFELNASTGDAAADSHPFEDSEAAAESNSFETVEEREAAADSHPLEDTEAAAESHPFEDDQAAVESRPSHAGQMSAGSVPPQGIEIVGGSVAQADMKIVPGSPARAGSGTRASAFEFNRGAEMEIVSGFVPREDIQNMAWWESRPATTPPARIFQPQITPDLSDCFLEPCTGSSFVEDFLQSSPGMEAPGTMFGAISGTGHAHGAVDPLAPYAGSHNSVTPVGHASTVCDGMGGACDGGCVSAGDRCDDGCGRSFLHHGADSEGGIGSLFGNLFGWGSGESDGAVRGAHGSGHSHGSRKCRECNGRGCRHCRRHARGAHGGVAAGGGFGDRFHNGGVHCPHGYVGDHCPVCTGRAFINDNHVASFLGAHAARYRARNMMASQSVNAYLRCKLGYFLHDGAGGVGVMPVGHYSIVYPNNPGYFDGRDGQVYAAHGFGGPISVPLAPVVRQTYNYGWGIPSSRLTPISHPVY